jgi:hypothetical protein
LDDQTPLIAPPPAGHPRPFPLSLVAYDDAAYNTFREQHDLPDFLPQVVTALEVQTSTRPGRFAVTVYNRQGGIPLFYLHQEITRPMVQAAAVVSKARPLYTDSRFSPVITEFRPPEPPDARLRYVIAAAAQFGVIRVTGDGEIDLHLPGLESTVYPSMLDAEAALHDDTMRAAALARAVDACFAATPETQRAGLLREVLDHARTQASLAGQRHEPAVQTWWRATAVVIEERLNNGRYHLG